MGSASEAANAADAAITAKAEKCSVDQVWLRRAKDKIDHLTREREEIGKALHTVNERIRDVEDSETMSSDSGAKAASPLPGIPFCPSIACLATSLIRLMCSPIPILPFR